MVRWNWTKNTWKCNACGAENNPPLANFCSQCGSLADKVPLVAAPIAPAESRPPEEHLVPLRGNPDLLLNIFGVALVVEKTTGNMVVFSDPLRENIPIFLPRITEGIAHVCFDQWWVYVLNTQGTLSVFPVSALSNEYMAKNRNWQPYAENVHKFWLFKNRLLVFDEAGRRIKIGDIPSIHSFWAEEEKTAYKSQDIDAPFDVETLVPLQGEDFLLVLVGENNMALLTDEGVSDPEEFLEDGKIHWIGSNREGLLRLASRQENGDVRIISFSQDNLEPIPDTIPDLQATALHSIDIDGQDWFVVITPANINLVDPLNGSIDREYSVFMSQTDICSSFGNLVVGFQDNEDPNGLPLVALFRFDRNSDISRLRFWSLKTGLTPVTAPVGFGHSVYALMREENYTMLYCYPLNEDGEA